METNNDRKKMFKTREQMYTLSRQEIIKRGGTYTHSVSTPFHRRDFYDIDGTSYSCVVNPAYMTPQELAIDKIRLKFLKKQAAEYQAAKAKLENSQPERSL